MSSQPIVSLRNLFLLLNLFFYSNVTAQWEKITENGNREFFALVEAGTKSVALAADGQIFYSVDKGLYWDKVGIPDSLLSASDRAEKLAGKLGHLYVTAGDSLFRSTDDGLHWQKLSLNPSYVYNIFAYPSGVIIVQAQGTFRLRDDSNELEQIDVGGNDKTKYQFANGRLWRLIGGGIAYSLDESLTWNAVGLGTTADDLAVKGDTVCAVNSFFGIYRSIDAGANWQQVYSQQVGQSFKIHADERGFYRYFYDDNRIDRSLDGFVSWTLLLGTNFQARQIIWQDGVYILATEQGLVRSEDDGATWSWIYQGIEPAPVTQGVYFIKSAADILLAGQVAFSIDKGGSWIGNPKTPPFRSLLTKNGDYYATTTGQLYKTSGTGLDVSDWSQISSLPFGSSSVQVVQGQLVSTSGSYSHLSPDDGLTWEEGSYLDAAESRIFLDDSLYKYNPPFRFEVSTDFGITWNPRGSIPYNPDNISATFSARSFNGNFYFLWRASLTVSKDRGRTWTSYTHPFYDPNGTLQFQGFVVNEFGVFVLWNNRIWLSPDEGQHWIAINENLPHHRYGSIASVHDALFAADYDGNIWKRNDFDFLFNTLLGTVYVDRNTNGQFDSQDRVLPGVALGTATGQNVTISDNSGEYALFYGIVPDTLRPVAPSPYAIMEPPYHVIIAGDTLQNFAVQLMPDKQDLSLTLTNATPFVPGFDNTLFIQANNPGTNITSAELILTLDSELEYLSASPAPTQVNGQTISWLFSSLNPLAYRNFKVFVRTPASVPINTLLYTLATVQASDGTIDLTPLDNTAHISTTVVSAYDPNDKQVSPAVYTLDSLAKRVPLDYTIRFQNTGNFYASFVYLLDTLAANLDFLTFQLLASSHPVTVSAREDKVLEFFFNNINLPDTLTNEPGSHGFVRYSILPKQQLNAGEVISNTAHIYFDYNVPIVTNTANTVVGTVAIKNHSIPLKLLLYPNPSSGWLQVGKNDDENGLMTISDVAGQLIWRQNTNGATVKIEANQLANGCYFIKWETAKGTFTGNFIVLDP